MMSMPTPILFVFVVLLGWPVLQLVSVLLVRSRRARLKLLAADLRADPGFTMRDREVIEEELSFARAGRGEPVTAGIMAVTPLILPMIIAREAIRVLDGRGLSRRPSVRIGDRIGSDPRFKELHRLSVEIGWIRRPVAGLLAALLSLPILPLALLAFGTRGASSQIREAVNRFTQAAAHG